MPLFGSHLSIAGGYYKAVDAAAELGMDAVQLFTKNNNQWAAKPLSDDDVRLFREAIERTGIQQPVAHQPRESRRCAVAEVDRRVCRRVAAG